MRRLSVIGLCLGVLVLPLGLTVAVIEQRRAADEMRAGLSVQAGHHATRVQSWFTQARTLLLLTANQPAFRRILQEPDRRVEATGALSYLQSLYTDAIPAASLVRADGHELIRVVRGREVPRGDLTLRRYAPWFAEALEALHGQVHHSRPYVSPFTNERAVAATTLVPTWDGRKRAIVQFDVTLKSFEQRLAVEAEQDLLLVDRASERVLLAPSRPKLVGSRRFAGAVRGADGVRTVDGRMAVVRAIAGEETNTNDWALVAVSKAPVPTLAGQLKGIPAIILALGLLLAVAGAFGLRANRRALETVADTDALTGLPNRRALLADLERCCANGQAAVLLLFDLNGFKGYNDTFGHQAGDALLVRLGHQLTATMRGLGRGYRLGGDEFCVLADARHRAEVETLAPLALSDQGEGFAITASYGAVLLPSEAGDVADALRIADQRMYAAKRSGRASVERQTSDALLTALAERHPSLSEHLDGVADLAEEVAHRMGLPPDEIRAVRHAAELHDVGKVAIPDAIIEKPGPLDDEEWAFMRRHTEIGERIVASAPSLAPVGRLVRASHERWDGGGYPDGLAGTDIPLGARIVCVCDAFDAMTSDRPYSRAKTTAQALAELRRCSGTQFDPGVVEAFARVLAERGEREGTAHAVLRAMSAR